MSSPLKKAKSSGFSRFVSSLRSKRGDSSPLVVQTGFPTSLADIVVKNRSRLRKPSSRKKNQLWQQLLPQHPSPPPPSPTLNPDSFGCRVSQIISAIEEPEEESVRSESGGRTDFVGDDRGVGLDEIVRVESTVVAGVDEIVEELKSDDPFVSDGVCEEKSNLCAASRGEVSQNKEAGVPVLVPVPFQIPACRRVGFQAKVVLVMILAVCTKELVLGIMLSAFALLLIESVGNHLHVPKISCIASQNISDAAVGGHGSSNGFLSNGSDKSKVGVLVSDVRRIVSAERKDLAMIERRIESSKMEVNTIKVKKKPWGKKVADKFRGGKHGKDPKEPISDLRIRGSPDRRDAEGVEIIKGPEGEDSEEDDEETPCLRNLDESVCGHRGQDDSIVENAVRSEKISTGQWCYLFLFIIVLSGLVGGRVVALVLTVACCYLMKLPAVLSSCRQIRANDSPVA